MLTEKKSTLETELYVSKLMLELGIPAHLRGYYYPDAPWLYSEDINDARKGLLSGFPVEEVLYNSGISNNGRNDFDFGL